MMFNHEQFSRDLKVQKALYKDGQPVDWPLLEQYIAELEKVDLSVLKTDAEKKSFWINVYNAVTNYWVIKKKIKKSIMESPFMVMLPKVNIAGHRFSLDDIEHGVLRKNRRSLYKLWKQFGKNSPRNAFVVEKLDHRIHFALNCGAQSCPTIAFYTPKLIDRQLTMAEESFAEQEFLVDDQNKVIKCSRIYWMYKKDFENIYIDDPKYKDYKVSYRKYDFSI
ncbi:MAG: DUF547 domain-containing protein [Aureispira sp.]|nr:DUF547 domain-containing protein [Aureispira sp.]